MGYSVRMFIPELSSEKSFACGRWLRAAISIGLVVCFVGACRDFGVSSALGVSIAVLLATWLLAVLLVMWAAGPFDISMQRLRKNVPGWFKSNWKRGSPIRFVAAEIANILRTRYLAVPTPPPRLCLAYREAPFAAIG